MDIYCVTYGRIGQRCIPFRGFTLKIYGVKIYRLQKRVKDNVFTWRLHSTQAERSGSQAPRCLAKEAAEVAKANGWRILHVQHGTPCRLGDIELLALEAAESKPSLAGG